MRFVIALVAVGLIRAAVSEGGIIFATHGQNNFTHIGGSRDLRSTESYLVPHIAAPVASRVGTELTAVMELRLARERSGGWSFQEQLRSDVHPDDSPAISELVVLMNWEDAADGSISGQFAGGSFGKYVRENHADWFSRFGNNVAVSGHSRGAVFVDEFTETLGKSNITVDTATYLDPIPVSSFGDRTPGRRDNVIYAQTLRQRADSPGFRGIDIPGTTNIDVSGVIRSSPTGSAHFVLQTAFGDTIDQTRRSVLRYGGQNPDRNEFGGEFLHIGNRPHSRPLNGLHPVAGGQASSMIATRFDDSQAWPALTLTQDSRADLFLGSDDKLVDLVYRDPDSESLALRVLTDLNPNLYDGFESEVLSTTLDGGQSEWNVLESFDLSAIGDEMPWIHFELSDGSLTSHATFPVNPAPTPLQAGDSDQDLDFDQFDLIRAQAAAKYLTGQTATWGEGDWNAAPSGSVGSPPAGDGMFNQLDVIAAQQAAVYLTGTYVAIGSDGQANGGQAFVTYDVDVIYVPEPASIVLLVLGSLALTTCRRTRSKAVVVRVEL